VKETRRQKWPRWGGRGQGLKSNIDLGAQKNTLWIKNECPEVLTGRNSKTSTSGFIHSGGGRDNRQIDHDGTSELNFNRGETSMGKNDENKEKKTWGCVVL